MQPLTRTSLYTFFLLPLSLEAASDRSYPVRDGKRGLDGTPLVGGSAPFSESEVILGLGSHYGCGLRSVLTRGYPCVKDLEFSLTIEFAYTRFTNWVTLFSQAGGNAPRFRPPASSQELLCAYS